MGLAAFRDADPLMQGSSAWTDFTDSAWNNTIPESLRGNLSLTLFQACGMSRVLFPWKVASNLKLQFSLLQNLSNTKQRQENSERGIECTSGADFTGIGDWMGWTRSVGILGQNRGRWRSHTKLSM